MLRSLILTIIFVVNFVTPATVRDQELTKVGDMLLTKGQLKLFNNSFTGRNAYEKNEYRWPLNIVPVIFSVYDVDDEDEAANEEFENRFKSAAADISKHSCIEFHFYNKFNYPQGKYPKFLEVSGLPSSSVCDTTVGFSLTGRRTVQISRNVTACGKKDIIHVILHTLGFFHMNNSPDRDQYVTIDWGNVREEDMKLLSTFGLKVNRFGTSYDYNSMMHDGPYTGSKDPGNLKTLIPKAPRNNRDYGIPDQMGQKRGMTKGDAVRLRLMYDCLNPYGFPRKTPRWPPLPGKI